MLLFHLNISIITMNISTITLRKRHRELYRRKKLWKEGNGYILSPPIDLTSVFPFRTINLNGFFPQNYGHFSSTFFRGNIN